MCDNSLKGDYCLGTVCAVDNDCDSDLCYKNKCDDGSEVAKDASEGLAAGIIILIIIIVCICCCIVGCIVCCVMGVGFCAKKGAEAAAA